MQEILKNLALIQMMIFAKSIDLDISGSYAVKNGRGFKYSLVREGTGVEIMTVTFHKSSVPTYTVNPNR